MFLNAKMTAWEEKSDFHNYDKTINMVFRTIIGFT